MTCRRPLIISLPANDEARANSDRTDAERALFDLREVTGEKQRKVAQDKRIILIPYTQDTLRGDGRSARRSIAPSSRALANIDKMGAKAIGIDILIDQPQPEDPQLLATLKAMKTPVWLAYATRATAGAGGRAMAAGIHGPAGSRSCMEARFGRLPCGSSRIRDNVLRRWPSLPPGLAAVSAARA